MAIFTIRLLLFTNRLPKCPSHCHFSGKRFPVTSLANRLPLYSKRLPRLPSDCLFIQAIAHPIQAIACYALSPSACYALSPSACYFLGKRLLAGRDKSSGFHGVSTLVHSLSYIYRPTSSLSLFRLLNTHSLSLRYTPTYISLYIYIHTHKL